ISRLERGIRNSRPKKAAGEGVPPSNPSPARQRPGTWSARPERRSPRVSQTDSSLEDRIMLKPFTPRLIGIAAVVLALSASERAHADTLLFWDFENVRSEDRVSVSVGASSSPSLGGLVFQTGGGPAEHFGKDGMVFLTRFLGTYHPYIVLATMETLTLDDLTFQHFHNHNPGYPTFPDYSVQLQLDWGEGFFDVGNPLRLNRDNSGSTD